MLATIARLKPKVCQPNPRLAFLRGSDFLLRRFLRLPPQEEIEIAAHDQVRSQRDLMGLLAALHQELVQHAKGDLALSARALIDGRHHRPRPYLRHKVGKQIGRDDGQTIEQVRVTRGVQHRNGCFCRYVDSGQIRTIFKQLAALAVGFLLDIVIFDRLQQLQVRIERFAGWIRMRAYFSACSVIAISKTVMAIEPCCRPETVP